MTKAYTVSVLVVTYEPVYSKLIYTLDSIVSQRDIDFEIIVSDDGSEESYFKEIEKYFQEKEFSNYKLIPHESNRGTVYNVYDATMASSGKYIKDISPGDALANDQTLRRWVDVLEKSGRKWSFGDTFNYVPDENDSLRFIQRGLGPQIVDCYKKHDDAICRMNYVAYDDIVIGAAVLCERDTMLHYLNKIVGKVIYAEDNIFRLMMFDNILPEYYDTQVVIYECGQGISTSGNAAWMEKIMCDWNNTNEIMLAAIDKDDRIQRAIADIYSRKNDNSTLAKLRRIFDKGWLMATFKRRFRGRLSELPQG